MKETFSFSLEPETIQIIEDNRIEPETKKIISRSDALDKIVADWANQKRILMVQHAGGRQEIAPDAQ